MKTLIINGEMIDPGFRRKGTYDFLLSGGKIRSIGRRLRDHADQVIDAKGCVVAPGFIDLHTHLREPGFEYKETIATGTAAAAAGGFTTIVCMANTQPVNDNSVITRFIREKAEREGSVTVFPVGAISRGLEGKVLADIGQMAEAGIVAVSDDGKTVMDSALMRKAMQYARGFGLLVISHCEDENLSGESSINEGLVATELGLPGSPNAAEELIVARDIALAELTGVRLHIAHLTTRGALELVAAAKKRGVRVSCEVTPHHLTLTDEAVRGYRTVAKVRPPLRAESDRQALLKGLKQGVIDAIATDHAPHASSEKETEFVRAANGVVGLESALSVVLRAANEAGVSLMEILRLLSAGPAAVLGLKNKGVLRPGADADLVVFDPAAPTRIQASRFRSKGRNCPFDGWQLKGRVRYTIAAGKVAYQDGKDGKR